MLSGKNQIVPQRSKNNFLYSVRTDGGGGGGGDRSRDHSLTSVSFWLQLFSLHYVMTDAVRIQPSSLFIGK